MHRTHKHHHLLHRHPAEGDEKARKEILTKPINKLFFKLAIPAIIGMFMYSIYIFVDAIFVGQWVGSEGLAAISIVQPLVLVNLVIASFFGMGFSSLLSRAIGANDKKTIGNILASSIFFILLFSLVYSILGYIFAEDIVSFMGAEGQVLDYGTSYFSIVILGGFFFNFVAASTMIIQAEGRLKSAMIIITSGSFLNIALDIFLIYNLGMGIEGAAIATVISMIVTATLTFLYYIFGGSKLKFTIEGLKTSPHLLKTITPVGSSGMAMQLLALIEHLLIYKTVSTYGGSQELALIGASLNMLAFAAIPLWGIAQGLQPLIGINFGAKQYSRVKEGYKKFLLGASLIAVVIWLLFMIFPEQILGIYLTDVDIVKTGAFMFRIVMGAFFLRGFLSLPIILFQSIGEGGKAFFMLLSDSVLLFVPVIVILPIYMGINGVWYAILIGDVLIVILGIILVLHQFRNLGKNKKVGKKHA
jgi:putative MATE family efflux protein